MPFVSPNPYGKLKSGEVVGGFGGKLMASACSGDSFARRRFLGRGRIGLSGQTGDKVSGLAVRNDRWDRLSSVIVKQ